MPRSGQQLIAVLVLAMSSETLLAQPACSTADDQALVAEMQRHIGALGFDNIFERAANVGSIITTYASAMTPACGNQVLAMAGMSPNRAAPGGCTARQIQAMITWHGGNNYRGPLRDCRSFPR